MPRTMKVKTVVPVVTAPPSPPAPKTLPEAKEQGIAAPGLLVMAPLVPKTGDIPGKPGDFVTTVLQSFWQSPTIQKLRNAVGLAIFIAVGVVAVDVLEVQGNLKKIDWSVTKDAALAAGAFSLASAYAAWLKKRDNDPVQ